jgi:hypothetical protein
VRNPSCQLSLKFNLTYVTGGSAASKLGRIVHFAYTGFSRTKFDVTPQLTGQVARFQRTFVAVEPVSEGIG